MKEIAAMHILKSPESVGESLIYHWSLKDVSGGSRVTKQCYQHHNDPCKMGQDWIKWHGNDSFTYHLCGANVAGVSGLTPTSHLAR